MTWRGKPLLRALRGEIVRPIPLWLMRQAGRYLPEYRALRERTGSFLDLCYAPERAAEATLQPIKRFGMDGAILFSDILLVPQAMGQKLWFEPSGGPKLAVIRDRAEVETLSLDHVTERLAPVYEAIREVVRQLPEQTTLLGFAGAPWTVATYMIEGGSSRDFATVLAWAKRPDGGLDALIDRLVEATAAHLSAEIAAGVEAVQLFDTWAGIVPEAEFDRLVIAPTRRIVERLHRDHPGVPVIGFPRGIGTRYRRYFAATGVDALSIDAGVELARAVRELQPLGTIQGNLDPKLLVAGGAAFETAVANILDTLGNGPLVFNLGHGVVPETPVEHIGRLCELIRAHG
ncbi:MAG TPA: uroporphyrinogen decarboxylase [Stellaceae bacterium]|nr:uroporphyrinogen decarboxylase [Stellaceae bacterium]